MLKQFFDSPMMELDEDIEIENTLLGEEPKNYRAKHCKTAKELDLFNFSSNYQTYQGGFSDLQHETGIDALEHRVVAY